MNPDKIRKVLIICTGNSARSILAEFMINSELAGRWQAFSAGVNPQSPKPHALRVLEELGINHESARSKSVDEFLDRDDIDLVITVCDHAKESCPVFNKPVEQIHRGIEDPADYSDAPDNIAMQKFREARDAIKVKIIEYLRRK